MCSDTTNLIHSGHRHICLPSKNEPETKWLTDQIFTRERHRPRPWISSTVPGERHRCSIFRPVESVRHRPRRATPPIPSPDRGDLRTLECAIANHKLEQGEALSAANNLKNVLLPNCAFYVAHYDHFARG